MFTPRPRKVYCLLFTPLLLIVALLVQPSLRYKFHNTLSYATRPLWDHADGPRRILSHYYADGMAMNAQTCTLHGWTPREGDVRVLDAVLMSSELDLLEIRLHELSGVVDRFFIVESNATFTGLAKETYFANNRDRFAEFEEKIDYHLCVAVRHFVRTEIDRAQLSF